MRDLDEDDDMIQLELYKQNSDVSSFVNNNIAHKVFKC